MRLLFAAITLVVWTIPASAQWLDRATPGIPRTPDGKPNLTAPPPRGPSGKIDFSGIWNGPVPDTDRDPINAQPWVNELVAQRLREYHRTRPSYQCRPSGPEADRFAVWKRIIQTPTLIAILNEDLTSRVIFMDGRELEANPAPSWMGYSVGHWEGDVLIVDSNGYNDKTWLSRYGQSHTEALRVRERWRRADFGHLQVEVTFTDPGAYAKPWGFTANMALAADTEMLESICERSSEHWVGTQSDAANSGTTVAPDVQARYVGVYRGMYTTNKRTIEVSLSGGQLMAKIIGGAAIDGGEMRPLVPLSQTLFEGLGIGYRFVVDDKGVTTGLVEIHNSGEQLFSKDK